MPPNTRDEKVILTYLQHMSEKVGLRLRRHKMQAQFFYIGVKSHAWGWLGEKSKTTFSTNDGQKIYQLGKDIISRNWDGSGIFQIQVTALDPSPMMSNIQKDLFHDDIQQKDNTKLNVTVDEINQKYGAFTVAPASWAVS